MGGVVGKFDAEIPEDLVDANEIFDKVQNSKKVIEFKKSYDVHAKESIEKLKDGPIPIHKDAAVSKCAKEKKPVSIVEEAITENLPQEKIQDHIHSKLSENQTYNKLPEKAKQKALDKAVSKASDILAAKLVDKLLLRWTHVLVHEKDKSPVIEEKREVIQTGGHAGGFIHVEDGKIAKKVGNNEFIFYTEVHPKNPNLHSLAPSFYGPKTLNDLRYVVIEDLTFGFKKACILDIKMGTSSAGEDATPEKKASMAAKDNATTTTSMGIRLVGARIYRAEENDFFQHDKSWGKNVTVDNFAENLAKFFHDGKRLRKEFVDLFLEKLNPIEEYFNEQSDLRFYSSSLLFIYDGHPEGSKEVRLKMIDFAHVHPIQDEGKDDGYIFGLQNLRKQLEIVKTL